MQGRRVGIRLRSDGEEAGGRPGTTRPFAHSHLERKFARRSNVSPTSMLVLIGGRRRLGAFVPGGGGAVPLVDLGYGKEAKRRLEVQKATEWDKVLADLLASWRLVADTTVYALGCARVPGAPGNTRA